MAQQGIIRFWAGALYLLFAGGASGGSALAGTVTNNTTLSYYDVHGTSFAELLLSVQTEAPIVNGAIALAFLDTSLEMQTVPAAGSQCKLKDVSFRLEHRMVIPRLANETRVPTSVRRQFDRFQGFLRQHEDQHRDIYLRCIKRMRKLMLKISAMPDCDAYGALMDQAMTLSRAQCDAENTALDAHDGERTARLPLISHALRDVANGQVSQSIRTKLRTTAMRTHSLKHDQLLIHHDRDR